MSTFLFLLLTSLGASPAPAPEPETWADPALQVREGLVLWLDAASQPAAWQSQDRILANNRLVDVVLDGSGHRRHFVQISADSQPRFFQHGEHAILRFDGDDDFLSHTNSAWGEETLTLVVVAAPRSNAGFFRGLFAANELGKNDYVTGLNLDLGPEASTDRTRFLNVEGRGFGGARNLLSGVGPAFGTFQTILVEVDRDRVDVYLQGSKREGRPRQLATLRLDNLTLGARRYSNDPTRPPFVSGFLSGDIAEVLLFDRILSSEERQRLQQYLDAKHQKLGAALAELDKGKGHRLRTLENPPLVQMLVDGFEVRELPLDLTNINNVRYRADGKLYALAYDGNVYLLSDTDGDGLEDHAELWWDNKGRLKSPIGLAVTPPGYRHGDGILVASYGSASLLVAPPDGEAEPRQIIAAKDWKPLEHSVDAMGVAFGSDESLYIGLGTENFTNGHLVDAEGKSHYDLKRARGAILKISPDLKHQEVFCSGIRFPVALAFNRSGDLFATDQEGATWLPNGNPFDELLHIQPGRHYGFPPRHPKHLPDVIDEPSVFDYTPQHQSTCGLVFNEPIQGGEAFGPARWQGDAIVCGESRGKLYRTSLVKTPAGYVASNQLFACLGMLTIDACVAPGGELVVACHGGGPDWGSGPGGKGKLFKIRYVEKELPQPVASWPSGPGEVRIAFDRPLPNAWLKDLRDKIKIEYGAFVSAGDRFEVLRPGYAVVAAQMDAPRFDLPVLSVQVSPDRRTLYLVTAPQQTAAQNALTLPKFRSGKVGRGALPDDPSIDLAYSLNGVSATWQGNDASGDRTTWLPHLEPQVAATFLRGSAEQEDLWYRMNERGTLTLRTQFDLSNMLHPQVQPGSRLDYTPTPETVTLHLACDEPLEIRCEPAVVKSVPRSSGYEWTLTVTPQPGNWVPLEIAVPTPAGLGSLSVTFSTNEDPRRRALPLRRFYLPWAQPTGKQPTAPLERKIPELAGGNWLRGKKVFEKEACGKCHRVRGIGGEIGPDLSNLVHRDYASVLQDIREPSRALNPDYIPQAVSLSDGRLLTGILRKRGEKLVLGDAEGKETLLDPAEIEEIRDSTVSIMPTDLEKTLGPEQFRDLLTYLLVEPPLPAPLERPDAPAPRSKKEVEKILSALPRTDSEPKPLYIVLCSGPKDHGPDEHDYPLWQRRWMNLLAMAPNVQVSDAESWPSPRQWETADVIVMYSANPAWSKEKAATIDQFQARGGGFVLIHYAVNGQGAPDLLAERIGRAWQAGSKFRHGPLDLTLAQHPITQGLQTLSLVDESYWNLAAAPAAIHPLGTGTEDGQSQPLLWTFERDKGRVFVSIPGHYTWTFDDPLFRLVLFRGICWAANQPLDRLHDLVLLGARVRE